MSQEFKGLVEPEKRLKEYTYMYVVLVFFTILCL